MAGRPAAPGGHDEDWPDTWPTYDFFPYNNGGLLDPAEREACKASDDNVRENDHAALDWGNPGKNHGILNKAENDDDSEEEDD